MKRKKKYILGLFHQCTAVQWGGEIGREEGDPPTCAEVSAAAARPVSGVASDQRCFDPGRQEGGLPRSLAKAKMEHGPLGPRLGSERVSRLSQWVTLPQPLGHGASANPLLTYEQPIGNCQTPVKIILPQNNEIILSLVH